MNLAIPSLIEKHIQSDSIKELKGVNNETLQQDLITISTYINKLQFELKSKDMEIFNIQESLDSKNREMREYDKLLGYSTNMTMKEKKQHSKKCNKNQKKIDEIAKNLDPVLKEEYDHDIKIENDIIDLALQQNELQFEVHEHFLQIKSFLKEQNYDIYKTFKRELLRQIDTIYKHIPDENKSDFFENLVDIVEKEGQVYQLDDTIKNLK